MTRRTLLFIVALLLPACSQAGEMVIPTLSPGEHIYWGPQQNVVETEYMCPVASVADWDGDGLKDLMVGVYEGGAVFLYPNTGTNAHPEFDERHQLYADGSPISFSPY